MIGWQSVFKIFELYLSCIASHLNSDFWVPLLTAWIHRQRATHHTHAIKTPLSCRRWVRKHKEKAGWQPKSVGRTFEKRRQKEEKRKSSHISLKVSLNVMCLFISVLTLCHFGQRWTGIPLMLPGSVIILSVWTNLEEKKNGTCFKFFIIGQISFSLFIIHSCFGEYNFTLSEISHSCSHC